jgi:predicted ATPase
VTEAAVACRNIGLTCLLQGDFGEAKTNIEHVLRLHDPERDREVKFRFAADNTVNATVYLGWLEWLFGNFGRSREFVEQSVKLAVDSNHPSTLANAYFFKAVLEMVRGKATDALRAAEAVIKLSQDYGTALYSAHGAVAVAWARASLGNLDAGIAELRPAIAAYSGQGNKMVAPLYNGLLAELEAEGEDLAGALTRIDEALALAGETGEHWSDAFLHRIRGEILFKRDPENTAPVEEAFLTAIAIAQQQKAKSFELRAALSLAKLYQSTGRPAEAQAVLAPALEGFSPTPEFSEIVEARALLGALPSQS